MGVIYFVFMLFGVFLVRIPPPDWKPAGYTPPTRPRKLVTSAHVTADQAIKTPQFWLLWGVLFLNVTAGIGVLGQASPMIQEMFPGVISVSAAAGFVGLLSLFNLVGRFFWSSLSDQIGRKGTYMIYFLLGIVLYAIIPTTGRSGNVLLFVGSFCIILSMYGGGFATVPAYLRDIFGTMQIGAIHGRLLTAWSAAAIVGPTLVTYLREYQITNGVPKADAYTVTMYLMAGLLVLGLICNALVREVDERHHYRAEPAPPHAA
jgi:MFS family permease